MKSIICDFCGQDKVHQLYSFNRETPDGMVCYSLVECLNCHLIYQNPQPDWRELQDFYSTNYLPFLLHYGTQKKSNEVFFHLVWSRRSKLVTRLKKKGILLDIGCATGNFLAEIDRVNGWETHGVEPVNFAAEEARRRTKAKIFTGDLFKAEYPDNYFDVVTFWDVLEHLQNPADYLREAYRILNRGGFLLIRTPDPSSLVARLFGRDWVNLDVPRHLFLFPKRVLMNYLNVNGFGRLEIVYLTGEYFSFWASLGNKLFSIGHPQVGAFIQKIAASRLLRIITAPVFMVPNWIKSGSAPIYLVQKDKLK